MIVSLVLWLASCLMSHVVNILAAVDCGELTDPANGQVLTEKGNLIPCVLFPCSYWLWFPKQSTQWES